MTITPNPTAELRRCPEDAARPDPSRPTGNPPDRETHADVDGVVLGWVEVRKSMVVSAVEGPTHFTNRMNPASWCRLESHAAVEVSGRGADAGYTRDFSTGTGFSGSRVPGSVQRDGEPRSRLRYRGARALSSPGRT